MSENKKPLIINNPEVVIEKRPGPNYIKTPLSEYKEWELADGKRGTFGGTWYKVDDKAIASEITENIFNSRLVNKELESIGKSNREDLEDNEINRTLTKVL
jgi:hypothetical protein